MPTISVKPHDKAHLRRQIARFQSLHQALSALSRECKDLENSYTRAARWLDDQGAEYRPLVDKLRSMGNGAHYQARTLDTLASQIEENWDIAMSLKTVVFHDDLDVTPLEYGLPLDVIGTPPTDEEMKDLLHERQ